MALIVASGVLPLRLVYRPEASTRLAISFACSGSPALRSTSIATCLAGSPLPDCGVVAMVMASFSSLGSVGGAARRIRCRRSSATLRSGTGRWLRAWRCRFGSGHCQIGPPVGQSMQRTLSPRWSKPYWSGIVARSGRECEPRHGRACQLAAVLEEFAELLADLAAPRFAFFPLVRVDAQGGVGFAVAEPALYVDDGDVERDQHAGVAVAQVVQARLRRRDPGRLDRTRECGARGLAHQPAAASAREHERGRVVQRAPLGDQRDEPAHELWRDVDRASRLLRLQRRAAAVAAELVLDPDQRVLAVEVADSESERFADAEAGGEQQFEQAAVLLAVGGRDQ